MYKAVLGSSYNLIIVSQLAHYFYKTVHPTDLKLQLSIRVFILHKKLSKINALTLCSKYVKVSCFKLYTNISWLLRRSL